MTNEEISSMPHSECLRGAYKLIFKEICPEPDGYFGVASGNSFKLFLTPEGFICTTRIKRASVGYCMLYFPYFPLAKRGKPSKYSDGRDFRTYKCTSIKSTAQFQRDCNKKHQHHLFIHGSIKSKPFGVAIRQIAKDITQAETWKAAIIAMGERPLKPRSPHFCFWVNRDRDLWQKSGVGALNDGGWLVALKRDAGRFKYARICSTADFFKIVEMANMLERYGYFQALLKDLNYL